MLLTKMKSKKKKKLDSNGNERIAYVCSALFFCIFFCVSLHTIYTCIPVRKTSVLLQKCSCKVGRVADLIAAADRHATVHALVAVASFYLFLSFPLDRLTSLIAVVVFSSSLLKASISLLRSTVKWRASKRRVLYV